MELVKKTVFLMTAAAITAFATVLFPSGIQIRDFFVAAAMLGLCAALFALLYMLIKRGAPPLFILIGILFFAAALRVFGILAADTMPTSDFAYMYNTAASVAKGELSELRGLGYAARFPHLIGTILYFSVFFRLFSAPLMAIKAANVILSLVSVIIIMLCVKESAGCRSSAPLFAALLAAVYPPLIIYSGILCSENIAMPLLLGSVFALLRASGSEKPSWWLLLSAFLLVVASVFRSIGIIFAIAYGIYIVLSDEFKGKKTILLSRGILFTTLLFFPVFNIPLMAGITELPLYRGSEPLSVSILKGSNLESLGGWTEEDAKVPSAQGYDYEKVDEEARRIIVERLRSYSATDYALLISGKIRSVWGRGDFGALQWTESSLASPSPILPYFPAIEVFSRLLQLALLIAIWRGILIRSERGLLFYLLILGFAALHLLIEAQPRYGYIISFAFIPPVFIGLSKK